MKGEQIMSTVEYIIAFLGAIVVIGGFIYGIYDTYSRRKDSDHETENPESERAWH